MPNSEELLEDGAEFELVGEVSGKPDNEEHKDESLQPSAPKTDDPIGLRTKRHAQEQDDLEETSSKRKKLEDPAEDNDDVMVLE